MGYASYLEYITVRYYDDADPNVERPQDGPGTGVASSYARRNSPRIAGILSEIDAILPKPPFNIDAVLKTERDLLQLETRHIGDVELDDIRAFRIASDVAWLNTDERWRTFVAARLDALVNYRPRLREVGPLWLDERQRQLVARDHGGHRRVNAAAGTGKTVVLVHRAIRLFARTQNTVLVVTPSDALATEIEDAIHNLAGIENSSRLRVRSLSQIIDAWHEHMGRASRVASHDILDLEWNAFIDAADAPSAHVLKAPDMVRFLTELGQHAEELERRKTRLIPRWVDIRRKTWLALSRALNYVREEMIYIASGFRARTIDAYTGSNDMRPAPRLGREIPLERHERRMVMKILDAWNSWLAGKKLMESTAAAAELVEELVIHREHARDFEQLFAADHVLVDEAQELGTSEWSLILRLARDIRTNSALLAAGDPEQRWRVRRLVPGEIQTPDGGTGFKFSGRAVGLTRQFRITRHIGAAAQRLVERYPKPEEEDVETIVGLGAIDDGVVPLVIETDHQELAAADLLRRVVAPRTVALVTARADAVDIELCERVVRRAGCDAVRFQRVGKGKKARVAYGTIDAVSGCEFDVVIVLNFSALPASHLPKTEWWRDAATAYQVITRARELVVLCCPSRSPFVDALLDEPPVAQVVDSEGALMSYLAGLASRAGVKR